MRRLSDSIKDDFASIVDDLEDVTVAQWSPGGSSSIVLKAKRVPLRNVSDPERSRGTLLRSTSRWHFPARDVVFSPKPADTVTDSKSRAYTIVFVSESAMTGVVRADCVELEAVLAEEFTLETRTGERDSTRAPRAKFSQQGTFRGRLLVDGSTMDYPVGGRYLEAEVRLLARYQDCYAMATALREGTRVYRTSDSTQKWAVLGVDGLGDLEGFVTFRLLPDRTGGVAA